MISVLLQAGHENRTSGATGATGPNGWTERDWTPIVANSAAAWLRENGVEVFREDASFNRTYDVDYAIFMHFDGSTNTREDDASVGYSTTGRGGTNDKEFASFWKDYYVEKGWDFGFNGDNFTTNLSQYYGYRSAINTTAEILIEFGTMSNRAAAEWMQPRLEDMGVWVAEAIYIDAFGALPDDDLPDLLASNVAVSDNILGTGETFDVTYDISNTGDGQAADTTTGIYLSTNTWISTQDVLLGTQTSTATNSPGDVQSLLTSVRLPDGLAPGTYYIGAIADHDDRQNESVENNNNSRGGVAVTIDERQPDLIADNFRVTSANIQPGETLDFTWQIANIGDGDQPRQLSAGVYLSRDRVVDTNDTLLHADAFSTLKAGERDFLEGENNVALPSDIGPGTYYLGVIADHRKAVAEPNESNNASSILTLNVAAPQVASASFATRFDAGGTAGTGMGSTFAGASSSAAFDGATGMDTMLGSAGLDYADQTAASRWGDIAGTWRDAFENPLWWDFTSYQMGESDFSFF